MSKRNIIYDIKRNKIAIQRCKAAIECSSRELKYTIAKNNELFEKLRNNK
ncbi:MAG: hypothetical protein GY739_19260 [Mesoflavibacter sp.]|nr:hypothetical protein [Mesoflavibacter sp.]